MNLEVCQLLISIVDSPRRPHLLTPGSRSLPCALYLPPFHSTRCYFTINKFRRGVLWRGEGKAWRVWQLRLRWEGRHPTIKTTSWALFVIPRSHRTSTALGWMKEERGGETHGLDVMENGRRTGWRTCVNDTEEKAAEEEDLERYTGASGWKKWKFGSTQKPQIYYYFFLIFVFQWKWMWFNFVVYCRHNISKEGLTCDELEKYVY